MKDFHTHILSKFWDSVPWERIHVVVRMHPGEEYDDEDTKRRFKLYYENDVNRELQKGQIPVLREKWSSLSEYVKEVKQGFSRFYNKAHKRKGFFGPSDLPR